MQEHELAPETYHIGDKVKIHYPTGIVKGEIIGMNDVSIEDGDKYFYVTRLYLVVSDGEKIQTVTEAFMSKVSVSDYIGHAFQVRLCL